MRQGDAEGKGTRVDQEKTWEVSQDKIQIQGNGSETGKNWHPVTTASVRYHDWSQKPPIKDWNQTNKQSNWLGADRQQVQNKQVEVKKKKKRFSDRFRHTENRERRDVAPSQLWWK